MSKYCLPVVNNFPRDMLIIEMASTLTKHENEEALNFFMNAWSFWFCQNKWIHEDTHVTPEESVEHATSLHLWFK